MQKLSGQTALVTGAAKRLGKSMALSLAGAGADVVLHYNTSKAEAEAAAKEIRGLGRRVWLVSHDLIDSDSAAGWFGELCSETDGLDILINSASDFPKDRYAQLNRENLGRSMDIHLLSPLAMIQAMYRDCRQRGKRGVVINILDTRAADADAAHVSYHLGKTALMTATRELAASLAPTLRINAVAPGLLLPPDGRERSEKDKRHNLLEIHGTEEDAAEAVLYLCSAGFVAGQILFVDGGRHLKGMHCGL